MDQSFGRPDEGEEKRHLNRISGRHSSTLVNLTTKANSNPRSCGSKSAGNTSRTTPAKARSVEVDGFSSVWLQRLAGSTMLHTKLCRHWNEFFNLSILANFQYFPSSKLADMEGRPVPLPAFTICRFLSSTAIPPIDLRNSRASYHTNSSEMWTNTLKSSGQAHAASNFGAPTEL